MTHAVRLPVIRRGPAPARAAGAGAIARSGARTSTGGSGPRGRGCQGTQDGIVTAAGSAQAPSAEPPVAAQRVVEGDGGSGGRPGADRDAHGVQPGHGADPVGEVVLDDDRHHHVGDREPGQRAARSRRGTAAVFPASGRSSSPAVNARHPGEHHRARDRTGGPAGARRRRTARSRASVPTSAVRRRCRSCRGPSRISSSSGPRLVTAGRRLTAATSRATTTRRRVQAPVAERTGEVGRPRTVLAGDRVVVIRHEGHHRMMG